MSDQKYDPPERTKGDLIHTAVSAVLSVIPAASEVFNYILSPPLERRRDQWMRMVADALRDLESQQKIDVPSLQMNEQFIDTILVASNIAMRNSSQEKKEALKNAIINAALPHPIDATLQQIFLETVDVFSVWHLKMLRLFHEPASFPTLLEYAHRKESAQGLVLLLEKAFPELVGKSDLYSLIYRDLYIRGLVRIADPFEPIKEGHLLASSTTKLGRQFLAFISA